MIDLEKKKLEKKLFYDDTMVLKYYIEYPVIDSSLYKIDKFNDYNESNALKFRNFIEEKLYSEAINFYKDLKSNNQPVRFYEIVRKVYYTFSRGKIVSLYLDSYIYTGGAHGETKRVSQTWNLVDGAMIELCYFSNNCYFLTNIFKQILTQINKNKVYYFDDPCKLILDNFKPENYYLDSNGNIIIFFNQYDIAPYSTGIPTFSIKTNISK